jgi:hypothetical protein
VTMCDYVCTCTFHVLVDCLIVTQAALALAVLDMPCGLLRL